MIVNSKCQENGQKVVEVLSISQKLSSTLANLREATTKQHEETIAAILTLSNGEQRTIAPPASQSTNEQAFADGQELQRISINYHSDYSNQSSLEGKSSSAGFTRDRFSSVVEQDVLGALYFRSITERQESIPDAYKSTFEWIYKDPGPHQMPWSNFIEWLRIGQGCYWINGKAGSGKSTLMRYLYEDNRTRDAVEAWSGTKELFMPAFFFWSPGTSLQKSQEGLLRSIMFEYLDKRRHLVSKFFPGLVRAIVLGQSRKLDPTFAELRKAFRVLMEDHSNGPKVCLFLDGLDEYEGTCSELAELVLSTATSTCVKIVVSSRPIPACVHTFSACPSLRLQDLTNADIAVYVNDKLSANDLMRQMDVQESGTMSQAISEIVSKASGVFLWVKLVVQSILEGLINYDQKAHLLRRIDRLPNDLRALYQHMFESMADEYKQQGALMLRLIRRAVEMQVDGMTVLQLSFAEEETAIQQALSLTISGLSKQEEESRCKATEGRMRSRCCGLIESQQYSHRPDTSVGFLHRSAIEFLNERTVWQEVEERTNKSQHHIDRCLLSSCLSEMKRKLPINVTFKETRAHANLRNCLRYGASLDQSTTTTKTEPPDLIQLLDELHRVMQSCMATATRIRRYNTGEWWAVDELDDYIASDLDLKSPDAFCLLLLSYGLTHYTNHRLTASQHGIDESRLLLIHLLIRSMESRRPFEETIRHHINTGFGVLLQHTKAANARVIFAPPRHELVANFGPGATSHIQCGPRGELRPWQLFLCYLGVGIPSEWVDSHNEYALLYCQLLQQFLEAGVSLKIQVRTKHGDQTALAIAREFLGTCERVMPFEHNTIHQVRDLVEMRKNQHAKVVKQLPDGSRHILSRLSTSALVNRNSGLFKIFSR